MNKLLVTMIASAGLVASASAMAVTAKSAPYIGGEFGYGAPALATDTYGTVNDATVGGVAGGGILGYNYALTQNVLIGAEFGYHRDGKASFKNNDGSYLNITSNDLDLLLTGTYLFNSGWNIFGKAGVARLMQSASEDNVADNFSGSATLKKYKPDLKVGLGYLIDLQKAGSINIFAQYGHIFGNSEGSNTNPDPSKIPFATNTITAGVTYNLPV